MLVIWNPCPKGASAAFAKADTVNIRAYASTVSQTIGLAGVGTPFRVRNLFTLSHAGLEAAGKNRISGAAASDSGVRDIYANHSPERIAATGIHHL